MSSSAEQVTRTLGKISAQSISSLSSGKLSFFGQTAGGATRFTTVSTAGATDGTTLQTSLNNLITALKGYGLV